MNTLNVRNSTRIEGPLLFSLTTADIRRKGRLCLFKHHIWKWEYFHNGSITGSSCCALTVVVVVVVVVVLAVMRLCDFQVSFVFHVCNLGLFRLSENPVAVMRLCDFQVSFVFHVCNLGLFRLSENPVASPFVELPLGRSRVIS
jgi:hypothetical protein